MKQKEFFVSKSKATMSQAEEVRRLATSKGVTQTQFQNAIDDGSFLRFFTELLPPHLRFPTWLTVRVGAQKNAHDVRKLFFRQKLKIELSDGAEEMLERVFFPPDIREEDIDFVRASNRELGLPYNATIDQSKEAGRRFGLVPCEPWDALALRIAHLEQSTDEPLCVMMRPIPSSDSFMMVFGLSSRPPLLLIESRGCVRLNKFNGEAVWVFRRQKKS